MKDSKDITLLREANDLTRDGEYPKAIRLYKHLLTTAPRMQRTIEVCLGVAARRQHIFETTDSLRRRAVQREPESDDKPIAEPGIDRPTVKPARDMTKGAMYLDDLYGQVSQALSTSAQNVKRGEQPLASVIVTSHNTSEYIEACLESLLGQTYPSVEIVVVDDASCDGTPSIVRRVAANNGRIRILQLNSNLGTYYAKNFGLRHARGKVIFFQDSDDISHPKRIEVQMQALMERPDAHAVRAAYSRIDAETEKVIPVNSRYSKLGLITLGIWRQVFDEIGYFNCTTKASDDEFLTRLIRYFGKRSVVNVDLPLYFPSMREGSLFADMVKKNNDGSIDQSPSRVRQDYVTAYSEIHSRTNTSDFARIFSFPRIRDAVTVADEMTKLANPEIPVVVNVCSIPERRKVFERTLNSVAQQCDMIHVYLDRYESEPAFLKRLDVPVVVVRSQEMAGLRDNGKFIQLERLLEQGEDAYYFTIDDDIEYPVDYMNSMIKILRSFNDQVVVGVHGVILKDRPTGYFSDRRIVYSFQRALERHRLVNVLGTGTVAFRASLFSGYSLSSFEEAGMADLYFASECQRRRVPQLCVARHDGWLKDLNESGAASLYTEFREDDRRQTAVLNQVDRWGYAAIESTLAAVAGGDAGLGASLRALLPPLRAVTRPV